MMYITILTLILVYVAGNKNDTFPRENIPFTRENNSFWMLLSTMMRQNSVKRRNVTVQITSFSDVRKAQNVQYIYL